MSPIRRRNTRSMTAANRTTSSSIDECKENDIDNSGGKRGDKRLIKGKKILVNSIDVISNSLTTKPTTNETSITDLIPVPLPMNGNFDASPASPRPMFIDPTDESSSSLLRKSFNDPVQRGSSSHITICRTPLLRKTTNFSSNVNRNSTTSEHYLNTPGENEVLIQEELNLTPSVIRKKPVMCAPLQEELIIPSTEKSVQFPRTGSSFTCRTSTPSNVPRYERINHESMSSYNDFFSIDSIDPETYEILSKFPEFRKLLKAYKSEKQKSQNWINDYGRLKRKYDQLEANSFPRPSAGALDYLIELVTKIQGSSGQNDPRTDEELARDLGISSIILSSLKESSPQQTALNLFNRLYPGYHCKVELGSAVNMEEAKAGQLESILVFAQRAAPGVKYTIQALKDAINNSIRSARFQLRRSQRFARNATNMMLLNGNIIPDLHENQPLHQINNQMDIDE